MSDVEFHGHRHQSHPQRSHHQIEANSGGSPPAADRPSGSSDSHRSLDMMLSPQPIAWNHAELQSGAAAMRSNDRYLTANEMMERAGILPSTRIIDSAQRGINPAIGANGAMDQVALNQQFDQWTGGGAGSRRMQQLPGGAVHFNAGMDIDADGAPDARRIDPYGSTRTTLRHEDGSSVNAHNVPYIVLPAGQYKKFGIHPGDIAAVRYNGNVQFAVFG
ncbi:MAG: hypothetical protein ACRD3W_21750, partial [Terriglobales bacterium]